MRHTVYFLVCLLLVGCAIDNGTDVEAGSYASDGLRPEYFGEYDGVWTINGKKAGKATLEIGVQQIFSSLPLSADARQAIADRLGMKCLEEVLGDSYGVFYQETGYSAGSCYFTLLPRDYAIRIKTGGREHTILLVMDRGNAAAVYDRQTTAFVVLFHLTEVRLDDEVVCKYHPSQTIQYQSTKKTRAGEV